MLAHFLALGDLIKTRIGDQMPNEFKSIAHAADLKGVKDSLQPAPALHVLFMGTNTGPALPRAAKVAWDQEWLTVVVTRSMKEAKSGAGAMELSGPLCGGLLAALTGWTPCDGVQPLEPIAPGVPPLVTTAGTLYVPLRWRARITSFEQ